MNQNPSLDPGHANQANPCPATSYRSGTLRKPGKMSLHVRLEQWRSLWPRTNNTSTRAGTCCSPAIVPTHMRTDWLPANPEQQTKMKPVATQEHPNLSDCDSPICGPMATCHPDSEPPSGCLGRPIGGPHC